MKGSTMHALPTIHAKEARAAEAREAEAILKQHEGKPDAFAAVAAEAIAKATAAK
jgi:hypothetical protein